MEPVLIQDKNYNRDDLREYPLKKGEYEDCTFTGCDLSGADLSGLKFVGCTFTECNLSLAKIVGTSFRDVAFKGCKMMGLHFDTCYEFGLDFRLDNCILDHSLFYKTNLKKIVIKDCHMHEVDMAECDLAQAVLDNCDLQGATFDNTNLEKANLKTAFNYSIDPDKNKIKKAKFSVHGIAGLLDKYDIDISM